MLWSRIFIVLACCFAAPSLAAESAFVRGASDFDAAAIEGAATITPDQVRQALRRDWVAQIHGTPTAPLDQFIKTVRERLDRAYAACGFPQAKVRVDHDDEHQRLVIHVEEGPRWVNGPVRVEGLSDDLKEALVAHLTQRSLATPFKTEKDGDAGVWVVSSAPGDADGDRPRWRPDAPTNFDGAAENRIRSEVRRCLAGSGYLRPVFETHIVTENDHAVLHVSILQKGPRALVSEIRIEGLERSTAEQVRKLIGLSTGDQVNVQRLQEIQQALWDCGRFISHTLTLRPSRDDPENFELRLDLLEAPSVTSLGEPLTEIEQALARAAGWLSHFHERDDDLLIDASADEQKLWLILSPSRGLLCSATRTGKLPAKAETLAMLNDGFWRWSSPGDYIAYAPVVGVKVRGHLHMLTTGDREKPFSLNIGAKISNNPQQAPVQVQVLFAPAALLERWNRGKTNAGAGFEVADGLMTVRLSEGEQMQLRPQTGQVVSYSLTSPKNSSTVIFSTEKNLLQQRLAELDHGIEPRSLSAGQAIANALAVAAIYPEVEDYAAFRNSVNGVLEKSLAPTLDRLFARLGQDDERFFIPANADDVMAMGFPLAPMTLPFVDDIFTYGAWPWTVARQTLLAMGGSNRYAHSELLRLHESGMGPLGYATVASLMSKVSPELSRGLAREGLKRLETEHFLADCRILLDQRSGFGEAMRALLSQIGSLTPEEAEAAAKVAPQYLSLLPLLCTNLRIEEGQTLDVTLEPLLRSLWETSLRATTAAYLNRIINVQADDRL